MVISILAIIITKAIYRWWRLIVRVGTLALFPTRYNIWNIALSSPIFIKTLSRGSLGKYDRPMMSTSLLVQSKIMTCVVFWGLCHFCVKGCIQMTLTAKSWSCWSGFCVLVSFWLDIHSWLKQIKHNESNFNAATWTTWQTIFIVLGLGVWAKVMKNGHHPKKYMVQLISSRKVLYME